jgi:DNA-binding NarL/FixJ family response regulator
MSEESTTASTTDKGNNNYNNDNNERTYSFESVDSPEFKKKQQQIEWRRAKVLEYLTQGLTQADIVERLKVSTLLQSATT